MGVGRAGRRNAPPHAVGLGRSVPADPEPPAVLDARTTDVEHGTADADTDRHGTADADADRHSAADADAHAVARADDGPSPSFGTAGPPADTPPADGRRVGRTAPEGDTDAGADTLRSDRTAGTAPADRAGADPGDATGAVTSHSAAPCVDARSGAVHSAIVRSGLTPSETDDADADGRGRQTGDHHVVHLPGRGGRRPAHGRRRHGR
ncbi:hypothetical protein SGRIM128S_05024 [Streptomyces griseomycini]|nr:hypothetical protein GCM10015536_31080 [Streptomyces griseomycini]